MADENTGAEEVVPPVPAVDEVISPVEETPNLEQERDARVLPVVQGVIEDLSGIDTAVKVNDRSEFTNVLISIIKRALAADLNLTTDNPYVFQLVLGAFGAFNQFVMSCKTVDSEDLRFSKIAHEIMVLFSGAKIPFGMTVKTEDQVTALESIRPQMEEIFAREMLTKLEITYILEGLLNAVKVTEQVFSQNVEDSVKRAEAKILQIPDMMDLTMTKLDWALQTSIDKILEADKPN